MSGILIVRADALHLPLADDSVQCIVTSPPYWGLRKYAGDQGAKPFGLEPSINLYIAHTVEILRECRRVLRPDGVLFWNIGDSYASGKGTCYNPGGGFNSLSGHGARKEAQAYPLNRGNKSTLSVEGLKPKDLCLIPARVALGAQADGWWVRSDIIWAKPNPMPESVTDRPTNSYEHILMLTKSERYFWNADALSMPASESSLLRLRQPNLDLQAGSDRVPGKTNGPMKACFGGRNKHAGYENRKHSVREDEGNYIEKGVNVRDVWVFSPQPYKEAHFATFPEELPRRCILAASKPGDLILDPFAGSGSTGRVAIALNRKVILIDLAYQHLSSKRTRNVQRMLV